MQNLNVCLFSWKRLYLSSGTKLLLKFKWQTCPLNNLDLFWNLWCSLCEIYVGSIYVVLLVVHCVSVHIFKRVQLVKLTICISVRWTNNLQKWHKVKVQNFFNLVFEKLTFNKGFLYRILYRGYFCHSFNILVYIREYL